MITVVFVLLGVLLGCVAGGLAMLAAAALARYAGKGPRGSK